MKRYLLMINVLLMVSAMLLLSGCNNSGTKNLTKEYLEKNIYEVLEESFEPEEIFGDENPFAALFKDTGSSILLLSTI